MADIFQSSLEECFFFLKLLFNFVQVSVLLLRLDKHISDENPMLGIKTSVHQSLK